MSGSFDLRKLRNIGISAHVDAGKTTLTERVLFYAGSTHKMGNVDDGNTVTDFMKQEQDRGITICSAAVSCEWNGSPINLIDTPGHVDFTMEVERSMRVLDGTIIVICAKGGVQPQTRTVWRQANRYRVPRILFVNKMDTMGASFDRALEKIRTELGAKVAVMQLPVGEGSEFRGVIDLLSMKMIIWDGNDQSGDSFEAQEIPAEKRSYCETMRAQLIESIVEHDDTLLEAYLEGNEPSVEQLKQVLRKATIAMTLVPVLCGSAFKKKGVQPLLDAVIDLLPSPLDVDAVKGTAPDGTELVRHAVDSEPLSALAFKVVDDPYGDLIFVRVYSGKLKSGTYVFNPRLNRNERVARLVRIHGNKRTQVDELIAGDIGAVIGFKDTITGDTLCPTDQVIRLENISCPDPVISKAIEAEDKDAQQKLAQALEKMRRADPSFRYWTDQETGQTIVAGLGQLHLEVKETLLAEQGIKTRSGQPQVSYRETIRSHARHEFTLKKQSGGKGMYAQVVFEIEPLPGNDGFEFVDAIAGGVIPAEFVKSVEKGLRSSLGDGPLAHFPVVGVRVSLVDGKTHDVDSSDMAFQLAASMAFKEVFLKAKPALLEPVMALEVVVAPTYMGDVLGDVARRRGRVSGSNQVDSDAVIKAEIPLSTTFNYADDLRGSTKGNGTFTMEFLRYEPVPQETAAGIIAGKVA